MTDSINAAIKTYSYLRTQCKQYPIDACTEAAQFHGVNLYVLADALKASNIDAARLAIL
jgi:hypothetical protein